MELQQLELFPITNIALATFLEEIDAMDSSEINANVPAYVNTIRVAARQPKKHHRMKTAAQRLYLVRSLNNLKDFLEHTKKQLSE